MPETGQWVYGLRSEIQHRNEQVPGREALARMAGEAIAPPDVGMTIERAEGESLKATVRLGMKKPRS